MVFDIDGDDAYFRPEERGCPLPTFIALNPANGHGHAAYLLEAPVSAYSTSSLKALKFFDDVQRGLTSKLGADRAYNGFLSKNPLSARWETVWQAQIPYRLDTLNDCLSKADKRKIPIAEPTAIGRNVTIFDAVRAVAYRHVLRFKQDGKSMDDFGDFLRDAADAANCAFPSRLAFSEIKGIVRSIAKNTWNYFSLERFREIQRERVNKRWSKAPTLTATKPWASEGISRARWYRKQNRVV